MVSALYVLFGSFVGFLGIVFVKTVITKLKHNNTLKAQIAYHAQAKDQVLIAYKQPFHFCGLLLECDEDLAMSTFACFVK